MRSSQLRQHLQPKSTPRTSKLQYTSELESELSEAKLENENLKNINQMVEQLLQQQPNAKLRNIIQLFQIYYANNQRRLMKFQDEIMQIRQNMNEISQLTNQLQSHYFQEVQQSQTEEMYSQMTKSSMNSSYITTRDNRRTIAYQQTPKTSRRDTFGELAENLGLVIEDNLVVEGDQNDQSKVDIK